MSSVLRTPSRKMIVDVVDDADRKIGEAPRDQVLTDALNFHTVHLFLFDTSGRLLLQQLAAKRERHPLRWGASVAAYLFAGESYRSGIRRRTLQELGVQVRPKLVGKIEMPDEKSVKFVSLFSATYDGDVTRDTKHIAATRFATLEAIQEELASSPDEYTPTFRQLFPFYLQSL